MDQLLNNPLFLWGLVGAVLVGTAVWAFRHLRSFKKLLTAELAKYGHTFISAKTPPAFDTGPFPKREGLRLMRRKATILGISGQWDTYRIVHYVTRDGEERTSWVRLRYEAFLLREIIWKPKIAPKHQRN
ncbi:MAG: hypothetical protein R3D55_18650 [Chloroflexota bacterium]